MGRLQLDLAAYVQHQYAGAELPARPKIQRNGRYSQTQAINSRTAKEAQRLLKTLYRLPRTCWVLGLLDQPKLTGQGLKLINLFIDKLL